MIRYIFLAIAILTTYILFSFSVSKTENYNIIRTIDSVEIRQQPALIYASHFSQSGNNSQFRVLANSIFGGNDKNIIVKCVYIPVLKKWKPVEIVDKGQGKYFVSNIKKIHYIERNNQINKKTNYNRKMLF